MKKKYGHDNVSVRMTFCANAVAQPFTLILKNSLTAGTFATEWKKVRLFESLFSTNFLNFLRINNCYLNFNRLFVLAIHVFFNFLQHSRHLFKL